jgi:hypothetical protein
MKLDRERDWPALQKVPLHLDSQNLQGKTLMITGGNAGKVLLFSVQPSE